MTSYLFMLCALPYRYWLCRLKRHRLSKVSIHAMASYMTPGMQRTFAEYECHTCETVHGKATFLGDLLIPPETVKRVPHPPVRYPDSEETLTPT